MCQKRVQKLIIISQNDKLTRESAGDVRGVPPNLRTCRSADERFDPGQIFYT